jgi:hypothetical protein
MPQNPNSPRKPLFFGLCAACATILYSTGYRGRHHPPAAPFGFGKCALIFICVFLIAFLIAYILRKLGVPIDRSDK